MSTLFIEGDKFLSEPWKKRMSANGEVLKNHKVRRVVLVHGTFAGDNALGVYDFLEPIEQSLTGSTAITGKLKSLGKFVFNKLVKDVGNYTPEYAQALGDGLKHEIACDLFVWGSGNFHLARLKGTVDLAKHLAEKITDQHIQQGERILLLGHSHAGQLFALLTTLLTLLENDARAKVLLAAIGESPHLGYTTDLINYLKIIKSVNLDLVTFGTPVRYAWGKGEGNNYRLLAIVNHRSASGFTGVPGTRDGDYVQQWGVEGTDVLPSFDSELNTELDAVLDAGRSLSALKHSLENKERRDPHYADGSPVKKSLLINYQDNAPTLFGFPLVLGMNHAVKTLFGHGVYTESRAMLFNIDTIIENFYR